MKHINWLVKALTKKKKKKLDDASERDKRRLSNELHISTVIDLRSVYFPLSPLNQATRTDQENRTEHRMAAQRRREQHPFPQPTQEHSASETGPDEQSNLMEDDYTHLDTLLGINRVLISLTGKAWERSLIWRLDWVNFLYVPVLPAFE